MNTHDYEYVEQLEKQLAEVTEERDNAVNLLNGLCESCVYEKCDGGDKNAPCWNCTRGKSNWELRPLRKEAAHA